MQQDYYDDDDTEDGGELEKMTFQIKEVVDGIDDDIKAAFQDGGLRRSVEAEFQAMKEMVSDASKKQERKMRQVDRKLEELTVLVNELMNRTAPAQNRLANLPPPSTLSKSFGETQNLQ